MPAEFPTLEPIILEARKRLDQGAWDFLVGGTESETTFRRNRSAFDRLAFRPRVLRDVSSVDPSATLLGNQLRIPVLTAPVGSLQRFSPGGAADAVAVATEYGVIPVVSSASQPELEDSAAATSSPDAARWYQLYIRGDLDWCREMVQRIEAAGYTGFVLTVDTQVPSRRERPMISGTTPQRPAGQTNYQALMTWDFLDQLRALTSLPFIVKGIQTSEDAALAVEHGVDAVWVSNHGGRQLDHALGSMDTLPEIAAAIAGRTPIILDGGIHRGTDILKAIALGANAVAIGRLQVWGLAAAGQPGLTRVLEILEAELQSAMALLGVTAIDQLTPDYISPAHPVTPPHEMSSWPNIPGGRIL